MTNICNQCGNEYDVIASHWSRSSSCEYPPFSDYQLDIITGLLMGDGYINRNSKTPRFQCDMISPNYLKYVDDKLSIFGKGVSKRMTAEENAKIKRESGFRPNATKENYNDLYRWESMTHPELQQFADWYSTGKKVWPEDIKLTPTVLKHWYCGDGCRDKSNIKSYIQISMSNEVDNQEKVTDLFKSSGLPSPSSYNTSKRQDGSKICNARFTVDQSKELWKYMGEPLPDFEYKWP